MSDNDDCFVCGEYMGTFKNELNTCTAFSERTISEIIEKFFNYEISEDLCNSEGVCTNCFIKFNEYDEFQSKADHLQAEIMNLMNAKDEQFVDIKEEQPVDEIIYTEYDENMIELRNDQIQELAVLEVAEEQIESSPLKAQPSPPKPKRQRNNNSRKDEDYLITIIDGEKQYTCDVCYKHFANRSRLKSHRLTHTNERNFHCSECGSNFKTSSSLNNHSKLHKNIFFGCDLCGKQFKGKHELKCHVEAIHLKRMDHVCQLCGKAFSRDKTLRQHLQYHTNDRNIACHICGFKVISKAKMQRHLKSHNGSRDYSCPLCGKAFLYSYNVSAHIKHVHFHEKRPHTDQSKLTCYVCNKKFSKIWKVTEHMKIAHNIVEQVVEEFVPADADKNE